MAKCKECGCEIENGKEMCLPCSLEQEELDVEDTSFQRFKKEKPKWT